MNAYPSTTSRPESASSKPLGLKALRQGRMQDPLLSGPIKNVPIPIYY